MIHIENLIKRYGDLVALNKLSMEIKEREIISVWISKKERSSVFLVRTVPAKQLRSTVSFLC